MRDDAKALAAYPEIAVVLGGGLTEDGRPNAPTLARAETAADIALAGDDVAIIVSGSHGDGARPARTEAEFMADRIAERGVARSRIFVEDESRDTVTNAAFVAQRYLAGLAPRRLLIVTSPFHMARSLETFRLVLGPDWPLEARPSAPGAEENEKERAATEELYLGRTRALLAGLEPGDFARIAEHARATLHERVGDAPRKRR